MVHNCNNGQGKYVSCIQRDDSQDILKTSQKKPERVIAGSVFWGLEILNHSAINPTKVSAKSKKRKRNVKQLLFQWNAERSISWFEERRINMWENVSGILFWSGREKKTYVQLQSLNLVQIRIPNWYLQKLVQKKRKSG